MSEKYKYFSERQGKLTICWHALNFKARKTNLYRGYKEFCSCSIKKIWRLFGGICKYDQVILTCTCMVFDTSVTVIRPNRASCNKLSLYFHNFQKLSLKVGMHGLSYEQNWIPSARKCFIKDFRPSDKFDNPYLIIRWVTKTTVNICVHLC